MNSGTIVNNTDYLAKKVDQKKQEETKKNIGYLKNGRGELNKAIGTAGYAFSIFVLLVVIVSLFEDYF